MSASSSSSSSAPSGAPAPDPYAALAALQQQMVQMQQHMQHQAQQQAAAQHAAQQAGAGAAAAPHPRPLPKIAPPSKFKGEMGGGVDDWIRALEQQFAYYDAAFVDEGARIKFAVAYLDGPAAMWWGTLVPKPTTWVLFVERLHDRFRPVQASMVARQKLGKMRQIGSVSAYASAFQTVLTPISDMGDADQVHHFVNGLTEHIRRRVWEKHPTSLAQAIEFAAMVEAVGNFSRSAMPYSRAQGAGAPSGSVPMDINHVSVEEEEENPSEPRFHDEPSSSRMESMVLAKLQALEAKLAAFGPTSSPAKPKSNSNRVPGHLSPSEISQLMRDGKCFRCKKSGHMKRECPENSKSKPSNY